MKQAVKSDIGAFRLYGNLYFVGSRKVSVHLIETECGLVMIDTGYPDMYEQILDSIRELGFEPQDICAIFHSHGHIDHYGCTRELKALSGAKTYISRIDNEIVNGTYDLSWAKELGMERIIPFDCDVLVEDGDCFTFGKTTIRCKLTPGHTDGVLSFFVNIEEGTERVIAAMHGGIGRNSMAKEFLDAYGLSAACRDKFRAGLHELAKEHVDLVMGNHPGQNGTEEKRERVLKGETAVDPNEWKRFLIGAEKSLDELLEMEENQA
ncbi:MAG: MBL fold metallo-hydrolase [Ruminococcaceae bacterium]|nr:MBL fold metallo-hydrolase [Oscillospiraceae bacterium]